MTLAEFQVKQHIFKYIVKISANERYLQTLGTSGKYDQIKESEKPAKSSRVSFILLFPSKHLFFSCLFFPINLKTLSLVFFNFSLVFTDHRWLNFYICDVIMQNRSWWLCDSISQGVSPNSNTFFVKKSVSKIYEWLLKLCECFFLSYPKAVCQALGSNINISITFNNFWMIAYFYNR